MALELVSTIKEEHNRIRLLIRGMIETTAGEFERRTDLFERFKSNILSHFQGEERSLYAMLIPGLLERMSTREPGLEGIEEHNSIRSLIRDLEGIPMGDDRWRARVAVIRDLVERHFHREEEEYLRMAMDIFSLEQLKQMYRQFKTAEEEAMAELR
jgi:hemerythrin-like domain-containing protein